MSEPTKKHSALHSYQQINEGIVRRQNGIIDSIKSDGDIIPDKGGEANQFGSRVYRKDPGSSLSSPKEPAAFQSTRYAPQEIDEMNVRQEAQYGTVEPSEADGIAVAMGPAGKIIKSDAARFAGRKVVKDSIVDSAKGFIKPAAITDYGTRRQTETELSPIRKRLIPSAAELTEREIAVAAGRDGNLEEKASASATKYGYKAGKYAVLGGTALVRGTYRASRHTAHLASDVKAGVLTGKEARVAALGHVKKGIADSRRSVGKIIKTEAERSAESFQGSEDLGIQALSLTKDVYFGTRRAVAVTQKTVRATKRVVKHTARAVKQTSQTVQQGIASAKRALSNPTVMHAASAVGVFALMMATILTLITAVTSLIPSISLKSTNKELTRTYEHITYLDAEFMSRIRAIEPNYSGIAGYDGVVVTYYVNGYETSNVDNIFIHTDADAILEYLDSKYADYAFDKLIYGLFGGTNVKDEVTGIHKALHSVANQTWAEEVERTETVIDEDTGREIETYWTENILHVDVYISTRSFYSYLIDNWDTLLSGSEADQMTLLHQVGAFTTREELSSPFVDENYYISKRWGWYANPEGVLKKHYGVDIPKPPGTPINNVLTGTVSSVEYDPDGFGNYLTVTSGTRRVLYAHLSSLEVTEGQKIKRGEVIGYVGATGSCSEPHLHLEYTIENGFNTNPVFFLEGSSGKAEGGDIVAVATSQLGNIGGQPYWSWYGFGGPVEWCACFVSWCADQCGYISDGVVPRFASCSTGMAWFQDRGLWQPNYGMYQPRPGDIIFFDWEADGTVDHVGIVEYFDGMWVHTIEGNSDNACRQKKYSRDYIGILGYGTPEY